MIHEQRIMTALRGEPVDRTPFSMYEGLDRGMIPPAKKAELAARGMGFIHHLFGLVEVIEHGVRYERGQGSWEGRPAVINRRVTPVGTIEQVKVDGWVKKNFVAEEKDYAVVRWIAEHSEAVARPEAYERAREEAGESGMVIPAGVICRGSETRDLDLWEALRSPYMKLAIDYVGEEQFSLDIAEELDELLATYAAKRTEFSRIMAALAGAPAPVVKLFENVTMSMMGPQRFREYLLPVYQDVFPALDAAGKKLCVHFDGQLRAATRDIAGGAFHVIESLTEPPEGDMPFPECRAAWPDKILWCNVSADVYALPDAARRGKIRQMAAALGAQGLLEVSEHFPSNWEEALPSILDELGYNE